MSKIEFVCEWLDTGTGTGEPEVRDSSCRLSIFVDDVCLTQSEDVWSNTVREGIVVSAYPLAVWFASAWWRLRYEPLPRMSEMPTVDWRMSHEVSAANHGFVWPRIAIATDGDAIQVWAACSNPNTRQSVRYLNSLCTPARVCTGDFSRAVGEFINSVLSRLGSCGHDDTALAHLWKFVKEDSADSAALRTRRLEAQLGYDPEECPDAVMHEALALERLMGEAAIAELATAYSQGQGIGALDELSRLAEAPGVSGRLQFGDVAIDESLQPKAPWERAILAAHEVRTHIGNQSAPVTDKSLYGLFGLKDTSVANWMPYSRQKVAIAQPCKDGTIVFKPRKRHPISQRFEYARFLGDAFAYSPGADRWLASTDLATARQKFQRAFAAEFLCPIDSLSSFLDGDYSETAIEEAACEFKVSEITVQSQLANNGYVTSSSFSGGFPYHLTGKSSE